VGERIFDRWKNMSFLLETAFKVCLQTLYGMQVQTRPEKIWSQSNKINYFYEYLNYEMTISRVVIITYDNRYLKLY
jgi:hypothetical protein